MLCIENGLCLTDGALIEKPLWIDQGLIVDTPEVIPEQCEIFDAAGGCVLPGFIDIHTHLDDVINGIELADTYESGSRIALAHGITTLFSFINQGSNESLGQAIEAALHKAKGRCHCHQGWHITPKQFAVGDWMAIDAAIDGGFSTIKLYTTYRDAGLFCDYDQIEAIAERLKGGEGRLLIHCEDDQSLIQDVVTQSGPFAHAVMRPPEAEIKAVKRIIEIAEAWQVPTHVVHVSTPDAAHMIAAARSKGIPISCETGPQYLYLNETRLKCSHGHRYLCSPPLRPETSRIQLIEALMVGGDRLPGH